MMRQFLIVLVISLTAAGCATQQAARQIETDCRLSNGMISSECASKHRDFSKMPPEYQRMAAYRVMLNEQIKNKQITEAQADVLQLEYQNKVISQANAAAAQQQASAAVANPALGNAGMTLMAAGQRMTPQQRAAILSGTPMIQPYTTPRSTNCVATGNMLNCNSY